ncbi:E3 ubiquitin-protein ligase HEL1 [Lachancea thermotolerans CBS 6340]|uniref:RBR-type E3 ubiquitin transferase n=1 Tax=Lachancea thermotolerans (strain ATCC 56472 / CBS 6340 / NRRL Y-8284) TaxID=559295 RepID=C5E323_LACTC|nr:KLTH0H09680p [Lachancea thermotolerans CBS 6340]CAR30434.1 KLTH0H09680p [Lachancea thermotolerans CBS 6340]
MKEGSVYDEGFNDDDDDDSILLEFESGSDIEYDDTGLLRRDPGLASLSDEESGKGGNNGYYLDGATISSRNVVIPKDELYENDGVPKLSYRCLTTDQIYELMLERLERIQPIFDISYEDIIVLLQQYAWSEERLLEDWTENRDNVIVSCGLKLGHEPVASRGIRKHANFLCHICCEANKMKTFTLECGHEYCLECYQHYIKDKLLEGKIITCMSCPLALKNKDIDAIMGDNSSQKLMRSSIKGFIQKHSNHYKWCPFVDCNCIIQVGNISTLSEFPRFHLSPYVVCDNQHRFCFKCGLESHSPGDCHVAELWVKMAQLESANLNWVLTNTKECPKCGVNIEKNGGCNHMTCKSCAYEFCWICEGCWAEHGGGYYECTRFKKEDKNGAVESKNAIRKYTFYYKLFSEHENSAKLDWSLGLTVEQKVKALQENIGISWIETQFLPESIRALIEGRTTLKWSFPVAFYSDPSHNLTKIFVDNQSLLVSAVEDLSQLLQVKEPQKIIDRKLEFFNKARFVRSRDKALVECGRDLLCKGICIPHQ